MRISPDIAAATAAAFRARTPEDVGRRPDRRPSRAMPVARDRAGGA